MAKCDECKQEMTDPKTVTCTYPYIILIDGMCYTRKRSYEQKPTGTRCHDCGVAYGGIHHFGCDMERCPKCGGQLISCGHAENEDIRKTCPAKERTQNPAQEALGMLLR